MSIANNIAIKDLPAAINSAIAAIPSGGTKIWIGTSNPNGASVVFSPTTMTGAITGQYTASGSASFGGGYDPWRCFDSDTVSSFWIGATGGVGYVQIDLGAAPNIMGSYKVRVNNVPEPARAPKDWTIEGSANGSSWTVIDTVTNQTGWGSGEERTFGVDVQTTAYQYYKMNITANNGDGSYMQIAGIQFLSKAVPYGSGVAGDLFIDTNGKTLYGPYDGSFWPTIGTLS